LTASDKVLVLAELAESGDLTRLTLELMGLGAWLAAKLGCGLEAVLLGDGIEAPASELASLGAGTVYAADHPSLLQYNPDTQFEVMSSLLEGLDRVTVLAGHTPAGQDLMPRLAFALGAGLVTDCVGVKADAEGNPLFTKPVFGGNALAELSINTPRRLVTVRARVGAAPEPGAGASEVVALDPPRAEPRVRTLSREKEDRGVQLEDARVVVAGGRGMGGPEGFEALEKLAGVLGGAVGASRPPIDSGWAHSSAQVGITGKIVAPDIYIAVAISGSSQHLSGMSESGRIVAVNQDPEAYIFKVADYGVEGDWKQVVPALTEGLKKYVE
jgi:electron transfer flavoprotein alpha subunit